MILSNAEIQKALDDGRLIIDPEPTPRSETSAHPECPYQTSAVDLRLGDEISVYRDSKVPVAIDLRGGSFARLGSSVMEPRKITEEQPFVLKPRRFVLGRTHETVGLPLHPEPDRSLAAVIEGKSSYARCGLLVHFTAPTIHAGFDGTITLEIINLGNYDISLFPKMPICQLIVSEVQGVPFRNDSQFQGQRRTIGGKPE